MRQLKHHEQKLLRKVSLYSWKGERNIKDARTLRKYYIQNREDLVSYKRLRFMLVRVIERLKKLDETDEFRIQMTDQLLEKLYNMGVIDTKKSLQTAEDVETTNFCQRRLPVVMVRMKMAETLKAAVTFIEQGHIRVGPTVVSDPAFLVTRAMEDFVTWVDSSKIRRTVHKYNDKLDDFDLL